MRVPDAVVLRLAYGEFFLNQHCGGKWAPCHLDEIDETFLVQVNMRPRLGGAWHRSQENKVPSTVSLKIALRPLKRRAGRRRRRATFRRHKISWPTMTRNAGVLCSESRSYPRAYSARKRGRGLVANTGFPRNARNPNSTMSGICRNGRG
jgi:hypothetical protein